MSARGMAETTETAKLNIQTNAQPDAINTNAINLLNRFFSIHQKFHIGCHSKANINTLNKTTSVGVLVRRNSIRAITIPPSQNHASIGLFCFLLGGFGVSGFVPLCRFRLLFAIPRSLSFFGYVKYILTQIMQKMPAEFGDD
jgi:hypothetical protein